MSWFADAEPLLPKATAIKPGLPGPDQWTISALRLANKFNSSS
ncbi:MULTISPECIES: hypothetical protein [unclassified Bradyrhizobium]|nr:MULTISPECIES: hypothetical protein [unclassified Bradyrhizobium]